MSYLLFCELQAYLLVPSALFVGEDDLGHLTVDFIASTLEQDIIEEVIITGQKISTLVSRIMVSGRLS